MREIKPDKQKAALLKKMAEVTLQRIKEFDIDKYPSNNLKDYYDVIHELMEAVTSLEGIKISGEGAHEKLINHIAARYSFGESERIFLQELRDIRNRITYEGFFVQPDYVKRNEGRIKDIVGKLSEIIKSKTT